MEADTRTSPSIGSVAFTVVLWLLACYILAGAFGFSYPANLAPLMLGGVSFILMTGLLIGEVAGFVRNRRSADPVSVDRATDVAALAWMLAAFVVVIGLGFLVGMSIAMIGLLRFRAGERWPTTLAMTAGVMLTLYFAFGVLLDVSFYPGLVGWS